MGIIIKHTLSLTFFNIAGEKVPLRIKGVNSDIKNSKTVLKKISTVFCAFFTPYLFLYSEGVQFIYFLNTFPK
ncbi:hypothetical protein CSC2_13790 [Clostridium zeae]|uniref:Uncharacterized protein n=1 Tax=Clostridium zeae TaxID=2759022 RepID=A0ABQ1E7Y4_9CLOT|nr:hypothetical protein CSC2_13790 [Clostridium zeae]